MRGSSFDAAFAQAIIDGHKQAIDLFSAERTSGDAKVAKFAKGNLPTLKQHLEIAESLQKARAN